MKNIINLTESQLHAVIKEVVKKILNEEDIPSSSAKLPKDGNKAWKVVIYKVEDYLQSGNVDEVYEGEKLFTSEVSAISWAREAYQSGSRVYRYYIYSTDNFSSSNPKKVKWEYFYCIPDNRKRSAPIGRRIDRDEHTTNFWHS